MNHRKKLVITLLVCTFIGLSNAGINNSVYADQKNAKEGQQAAPTLIRGKVTEVFDVSGYTYAEVDTGKKKVWAAGPVTPLKIGDMISFSTGMPMENFHSKSMKRDFSIVYFVDRFFTGKEKSADKQTGIASPNAKNKKKSVAEPVKGIDKVEAGNTIAEIYADKKMLNEKTIRVRGKVIKFTPEIMGRNWVHIRDSSTLEDLTVTTQDKVEVDDVVIIKGKLALDKDFGYGYVYPVILEGGSITKE